MKPATLSASQKHSPLLNSSTARPSWSFVRLAKPARCTVRLLHATSLKFSTNEGFTIGRNQVDLNTPIKAIGLHSVVIHLHAEVSVKIGLNVARSADEAERQAKGENLTSADAIYGVDEDALRPEDFFSPDEDGDEDEA